MPPTIELHPKMPASTQEMVKTVSRELRAQFLLRGPEAVDEIISAAMNCAFATGMEVAVGNLNEALKQAGRGLVRGES